MRNFTFRADRGRPRQKRDLPLGRLLSYAESIIDWMAGGYSIF